MNFPGTPVIILSMGRSGTSYLASFLGSNGVDLGSNLIAPSADNPRGYFEDSEIVAFHQGLLRRLRTTLDWDSTTGELLPHAELTAEEREHALRILRRLSRSGGPWGWKDPRTVHFIRFWLELLPESMLIVSLRHPLEILYSYLKRVATIDTLIDVKQIFRAYAGYHDRILGIVQERPHKSLVVFAQNALPNPQFLRAALEQFLGLPPAGLPFRIPKFEKSEFTRLCINADSAEIFATLLPEAAAAFDKLNSCSQFKFSPRDAPSDLRSSHLAAAVRAAGSPIVLETWLPLLIDLCRSDELPGYFPLQAAILTRYAEAGRFWKTQSEALAKELESHEATVKEQSEWIAQLEGTKQFWIDQIESHRKELESHAATVKEQSEWIAQLEGAKQFWLDQIASHRKELESHLARAKSNRR
jgi:hypothetical protein